MTVAILQLRAPSVPDPEWALREGERSCREAAAHGADIAMFPEMWQIGCAGCPADPDGRTAWQALATRSDGSFVEHFGELARELRMAVLITYLEDWASGPRNTATLVDRSGADVLTYAKVHTCDFSAEAALTPGSEFPVVDLDLGDDTVRVGVMICYDREFPESARALMLGGAEIVLTPNACFLGEDRLAQFRARAFENMTAMAMANYARGEGDSDDEGSCNGHSIAFSGIVCDEHGRGLDQKLLEADEHEGVFMVTFDLNALRAYRARETWGDAYRKPLAYGALVANAPVSPFVRDDSRRWPEAAPVASTGEERMP